MKPAFYSLTALAAVLLAAPALAQSGSTMSSSSTSNQSMSNRSMPAESSGASSGAMAQPMGQNARNGNIDLASVPGGNSNDQYWGVDTAGRREDVKAPYGGHDQAQADAREAPITRDLNEMELKGINQH